MTPSGAVGRNDVERLTVRYRVRFDESGPDGTVRTSVLLRYAQDCAWIHSERLGFDREWYAERDLGWLVRAVRLVVHDAPPTGAGLDVETQVTGFRRVMVRRLTRIRAADGPPAATIETDWVMTDVHRGAPTRIPSDFPDLFMAQPGSFEPHRVPRTPEPSAPNGGEGPPDGERVDDAGRLGRAPHRRRIEVQPHDLDPMGHANNGAYVDWLEACVLDLPDGPVRLRVRPRTYLLEYLLPARPEAILDGVVWTSGAGVGHRLLDGRDELLRARLDPGAPPDRSIQTDGRPRLDADGRPDGGTHAALEPPILER
jgi:acyl-CoA thioesterase FadM